MSKPDRHWHAWYTEDREFDSHEVNWTSLPASGVLWVTVYYFVGEQIYRENKTGGDWYWFIKGDVFYTPSGPDINNTWKPEPRIGCRSCVKQGVMVDDAAWGRVMEKARAFRGYHVHTD